MLQSQALIDYGDMSVKFATGCPLSPLIFITIDFVKDTSNIHDPYSQTMDRICLKTQVSPTPFENTNDKAPQ